MFTFFFCLVFAPPSVQYHTSGLPQSSSLLPLLNPFDTLVIGKPSVRISQTSFFLSLLSVGYTSSIALAPPSSFLSPIPPDHQSVLNALRNASRQ
ncbi:hypothetical protein L209DRAFT_259328 [Thermothelomyces heterothallicus CBS 203.75]